MTLRFSRRGHNWTNLSLSDKVECSASLTREHQYRSFFNVSLRTKSHHGYSKTFCFFHKLSQVLLMIIQMQTMPLLIAQAYHFAAMGTTTENSVLEMLRLIRF